MATTIDDFNYQKRMNKNQAQREPEKRSQNNADTLTRKGYIDRGMNSIQYLANRRSVDRAKWDAELAQEQARYNNQLNVLKQEQGKYVNNPGELARIDRQISALATEHKNNMDAISQKYIDEANGPAPKNKELTAEEKKNLAQGASNIASSLAGYFTDKLAQQDEAPGAQNLRNQAALHDEQAAAEEANEQESRQIANRDYRGEAEKNAVAGAATENAQKVANLGNVSAGAAALARGVKSADYNTHMARQDEQREKAVQKQREAYGARQTAEEERQAAEAENNDKRNMDIYNSLSRYLSMGGNNNVGNGNENQTKTGDNKEEAATTSGTTTAGTTPTSTTPPDTQQNNTSPTGTQQSGNPPTYSEQTDGTDEGETNGKDDEDKDDGFISMPDTPPGTWFPWLWSLPGFMRNDNNKPDENKRLPPDGTPDKLPSTEKQEELPVQEKSQELQAPENPEGLLSPQEPNPVIPPAAGNQEQEPVAQPAPVQQPVQQTVQQTVQQPVQQTVQQTVAQPVFKFDIDSVIKDNPEWAKQFNSVYNSLNTQQKQNVDNLNANDQLSYYLIRSGHAMNHDAKNFGSDAEALKNEYGFGDTSIKWILEQNAPQQNNIQQPAQQTVKPVKDNTGFKEQQVENRAPTDSSFQSTYDIINSDAYQNLKKYNTGRDKELNNIAEKINFYLNEIGIMPEDEVTSNLMQLTKQFKNRWGTLGLDNNAFSIHPMQGSGVETSANINPFGGLTSASGLLGALGALGFGVSDARQKNIIAGCYKRF